MVDVPNFWQGLPSRDRDHGSETAQPWPSCLPTAKNHWQVYWCQIIPADFLTSCERSLSSHWPRDNIEPCVHDETALRSALQDRPAISETWVYDFFITLSFNFSWYLASCWPSYIITLIYIPYNWTRAIAHESHRLNRKRQRFVNLQLYRPSAAVVSIPFC